MRRIQIYFGREVKKKKKLRDEIHGKIEIAVCNRERVQKVFYFSLTRVSDDNQVFLKNDLEMF